MNAVDEWKETALHYAAKRGKVDIAKVLLCFGAEITTRLIENDRTKLLQPIESRLKLLWDGF